MSNVDLTGDSEGGIPYAVLLLIILGVMAIAAYVIWRTQGKKPQTPA